MSKIAYTVQEAADACGVSEQVVRRAVGKGDLTFHYPTSRPVLLAEDLRDWIATAPVERPEKRAS